jgi:hypothetical protein
VLRNLWYFRLVSYSNCYFRLTSFAGWIEAYRRAQFTWDTTNDCSVGIPRVSAEHNEIGHSVVLDGLCDLVGSNCGRDYYSNFALSLFVAALSGCVPIWFALLGQ